MQYLILCLGCCFWLACSPPQSEKPLLPDEKLSRIMADLNVAEAATVGLAGYAKDSLLRVYAAQVFDMHGTNQDQYEKDLRLVSADLPRLQQVVLESIKLLEGKDPKANQ